MLSEEVKEARASAGKMSFFAAAQVAWLMVLWLRTKELTQQEGFPFSSGIVFAMIYIKLLYVIN